ncbi:cysteine desulfurase [Paenibacillus sp. FSL R7-0273]|uniref:cysteine desulfurase family protein n=1 Tax=Paenibacillus sp. FSL R7-0273 TaxID=1536772 RepID=UPI0004F89B63|nr:cysteine desulfurase family protein [Paenibacillus sp. FSL R7-0273]AIQ48754.1 cysteine desulfurase [Paenibacillus sp. FSL R7-0273]OMF93907.1 cysteine desulfurase NifS [Paenibacillus sp. FSL R7-0273]
MLYWDYAAASPPYEEVVQTMEQIMRLHYANPSSLHRAGTEAARLLTRAREVCAAALEVTPQEILFTSGATESNNLAVKGAALQYQGRGRHMVTTQIEHPSVYESFLQLQALGWEVTFVAPDSNGVVDPGRIAAAVRRDTVLVSVMHVNNETGAVQPLAETGRLIKAANRRTLFHVDGVQGFGKLATELKEWQADLYSLSAHKLRGPRGVGILYVKEGISLFPLLTGGSQEQGARAGTENVAAIVASAKAIRMSAENRDMYNKQITPLRDRLLEFLAGVPEFIVNSSRDGAPHIVHFSYPAVNGEVLARKLEELGMTVSTRSACSSRLAEPSRILLAMGRDTAAALGGIRISLGDAHAAGDIAALEQALLAAVQALKLVERGRNKE